MVRDGYLSCGIVSSDPDVLEIEIRVSFDGWAGHERVYVRRADLTAFADALVRVVNGDTAAVLDAQLSELHFARFEVFEYGRARRLGMHVHFGRDTDSSTSPALHAAELRITIPVERGQLLQFATDLRSGIHLDSGEAHMLLAPEW